MIVDTDSTNFVVDTGVNRIIVNDKDMLQNFQEAFGRVKGIGGSLALITGVGQLPTKLLWDDGSSSEIMIQDVVLVLLSPYNLVLPRVLLKQLLHQAFGIELSRHDDKCISSGFNPTTHLISKQLIQQYHIIIIYFLNQCGFFFLLCRGP